VTAPLLLVTGTDTEIGKTTLTVAVLEALRARGLTLRAIKPAESGVPALPEAKRDALTDGGRLAAAAAQPWPPRALVELDTPVAPPVAAQAEGRDLDLAGWRAAIARCRAEPGVDLVLVEGAGGLLSPLTWQATALDLVPRDDPGAAALLVSPNRLGTISQTRAALVVLRQRALPCLAVALNHVEPVAAQPDASRPSNDATLRRCEPGATVLSVGFGPAGSDVAALAAHIERWCVATSGRVT
jgi:dethiobiotin synthetase